MAIIDVLDSKANQYGLTLVPKSVEMPRDQDWIKAVGIVKMMPNRWEQVIASEIDSAIRDGIISDPELEARDAKSDKIIRNISDLKHHMYLKTSEWNKVRRTSLIFHKNILNRFPLEIVAYERDSGVTAFYALYNNQAGLIYKRDLNDL